MTSLPVKEIGSVMTRTASSGTGMAPQSANAVSFESVWNNQTERQNQAESASENQKTVRKEDDAFTRDSLKSKDAHKSVVKQNENVDETQTDDLRNMDPEEWEKAMEVLGAAAAEMIQQVADAFDMTVEEVQGLMADLGLDQLDVLQQAGLGELILAAGGAEDATALLTNEELYGQFQTLMNQLSGVLEECSDTLQMNAEQLMQLADEDVTPNISIEISDDELDVDEGIGNTQSEGMIQSRATQVRGAEAEAQAGNQTQNQNGENSGTEAQAAESKGQGENLLLQNLKTENFEPRMQQLSETVSAWDSDTMDIMKQIMDYMKIQVKPDMSNLEMQLHPENLGTLQIHVASKGGNITAQFVTQNETVKAALESQMIQLKESFAEQGVKVDAIEVTVQTHQFEQNLEQGRDRQQEEPGRRTRTRRIQLDALTMDDLNGMEEEEQLAAEMMAVSGNTVDYTA